MQNSQIPAKIVQPWAAGSSNIVTVPVTTGSTSIASWTKGFQDSAFQPYGSGGTSVRGVDVQGALNEISAAVRWMIAGAQFPWDSAFESDSHVGGYPKGSLAGSSDYSGQWLSTADNNTTNPETASGSSVPTWLPNKNVGVTSITVAGTNIVLTQLQASSPVIELSGTLTANISITLPLFPGKKWTINNLINDPTNSYTVTFVTAGANGSKGNNVILAANGVIGSSTEITAAANGTVIFSNADSVQLIGSIASLRNMIPPSLQYSRRVKSLGYYSPGDNGSELEYVFQLNSGVSGYYVDNGGTVIVPTGGDGSYAWVAVPNQNVNALHFGADPSFTLDSVPAINKYLIWCAQQAVTYGGLAGSTNGYDARLPAGRYKCSSSSLQVQAGVVLHGDGWGTSAIESARYNPPTGTTIEFTGSNSVGIDGRIGANIVTGVGFDNMIIKNSGTVATGIYIQYAAELCFLKRCYVTGFTSIGLNVDNTSDFNISGNVFYNNGTNGIKIGSNTNNIGIDFNYFNTTGAAQIYLSSANGVTVGDNNSFYNLPSNGSSIYIDSGSTDITIKTPMWDFAGGVSGSPVTFLNVQAATNVKLEGLRKKSGVGTSYASAVFFSTSAVSCTANLGVFGAYPPGGNLSPTSRITYNAAYEPGIYAANSTNQVIAASTPTVLSFATETYDPKNEWQTGNTYIPNDQGYYQLDLAVFVQNTASGAENDCVGSISFKDVTANVVVFVQGGLDLQNNTYYNIGFSGAFQAIPGHQYQVIFSYTTPASGTMTFLTNAGQALGNSTIRIKRFS